MPNSDSVSKVGGECLFLNSLGWVLISSVFFFRAWCQKIWAPPPSSFPHFLKTFQFWQKKGNGMMSIILLSSLHSFQSTVFFIVVNVHKEKVLLKVLSTHVPIFGNDCSQHPKFKYGLASPKLLFHRTCLSPVTNNWRESCAWLDKQNSRRSNDFFFFFFF